MRYLFWPSVANEIMGKNAPYTFVLLENDIQMSVARENIKNHV